MLKTRKFVIQETPYFACSAFCSSFWRLYRDPPQARECSVNSAMTTTLHIQELGSSSRTNPTQRTLPNEPYPTNPTHFDCLWLFA